MFDGKWSRPNDASTGFQTVKGASENWKLSKQAEIDREKISISSCWWGGWWLGINRVPELVSKASRVFEPDVCLGLSSSND